MYLGAVADKFPPVNAMVVAPTEMMPGLNGGKLRRGNPGHRGKSVSVVREALRGDFEARRHKLAEIADNKDGKYQTSDVLKALDLMAKYSLGNPVEVSGADGRSITIAVAAAVPVLR